MICRLYRLRPRETQRPGDLNRHGSTEAVGLPVRPLPGGLRQRLDLDREPIGQPNCFACASALRPSSRQ
jgi:hypothetical protein